MILTADKLMADVFISYSRADHAVAQSLADYLTDAGLSVWWDYDIVGGHSFTKAIMEALDASTVVIVIWSDTSVNSDFVLDEASRAKRDNKLITTCLPGFNIHDLPVGFGQFQCYPVTDRDRLHEALRQYGWDEADPEPLPCPTTEDEVRVSQYELPQEGPLVPPELLAPDGSKRPSSDGTGLDSVWARLLLAGAAIGITLSLFAYIAGT